MMKKKVYFENLDSLRTIAFLFVFFEHILWPALKELPIQDGLVKHMMYAFFANGGMGVSIFFVLSGFLITYLLLCEKEETGRVNVGAFYTRRILRIWPLYYLLIIVVLQILPVVYSIIGNNVVNNANPWYYYFFISNFDVLRISELGQTAFMQSSVTWSVSIEEQFYLVWPLLFFFMPKKMYPAIFMFFILLGLGFRAVYWRDHTYIYFHTLGNCADLALGGLCAWLVLYRQKFVDFFRQIKTSTVYLVYAAGMAFILLNEYFLLFPLHNVLSRLVNTSFYAFVLLTQIYTTSLPLQLKKFRFLNWSGKYTYGLYLLHPMGFFVCKSLVDLLNIPVGGFFPKFIMAGGTLIATYLLAWTSYTYYEKWFLNLKRKFAIIKSGQ
jgi:peptidoglycan/LPS O-acetylase OafA/YrhL